jgi:integrase
VPEAVLELIETRRHSYAPGTLERYRHVLHHVARHLKVSLRRVAPAHVAAYISARQSENAQHSTINAEVAIVRQALRLTGKEHAALSGIHRLRERRRGAPLTPSQLKFIIDELRARTSPLAAEIADAVQLAANTGMRSGEIKSLRWKSVNFTRAVLLI